MIDRRLEWNVISICAIAYTQLNITQHQSLELDITRYNDTSLCYFSVTWATLFQPILLSSILFNIKLLFEWHVQHVHELSNHSHIKKDLFWQQNTSRSFMNPRQKLYEFGWVTTTTFIPLETISVINMSIYISTIMIAAEKKAICRLNNRPKKKQSRKCSVGKEQNNLNTSIEITIKCRQCRARKRERNM